MNSYEGIINGNRSLYFEFNLPQITNELRVIGFSAHEGISRPYNVKIRLASLKDNLIPNSMIDSEASLVLYENGKINRYFHGIVESFTIQDRGDRYTFYEAVLVPTLTRLTLRHNLRIFQNQDVQEIINTLLKEMHIVNIEWVLIKPHHKREYCVQYRETDFEFMERLLAEEGIFYLFKHEENRHLLILTDHNTMTPQLDRKIQYYPNHGGLQDEATISSFNYRAQLTPSKVSLKDYCFKSPSFPFHYHDSEEKTAQLLNYHYYDYPGRYKDPDVGSQFVTNRLHAVQKDSITITAKSNVHEITAGHCLTLIGHTLSQFNADWTITESIHTGEQLQALEEDGFAGETSYQNQFTAIPNQFYWVAEGNPKPKVDGPQTAIVTGPPGEEIYCDRYGRVKIKFPWDIYQTPNPSNESEHTCWIRVMQGWAGVNWGDVRLPRVGQEVIVDFLNGDPDQPIIVGRVFNALHPTNYQLPELKTLATTKSKEHKGSGYNELLLDDTTGQIKTQLHTTHATTQLTMGFLTHPRKRDGTGEHRGDGFELRSDDWGAIRAGKGLYISSDKREKATGNQLDLQETINQLESSLYIAKELVKAANAAKTGEMDINDQESQLESVYKELKSAGILINSPEGIAITSPSSIQTASSKNITMSSMESTDISAYQDFRLAAKERVSLLAVKDELKIAANQGPLKIEAQANTLDLIADQTLEVISTEDKVVIAGKKEIVLTSGGAYIKIKDGEVEIGAPKPLRVRTGGFNVEGSNSLNYDYITFANYDPNINDEMFIVKDPDGKPISNFKYKIVRDDGEEFFGITNKRGETMRISTGAEAMGLKLYEDVTTKEEDK